MNRSSRCPRANSRGTHSQRRTQSIIKYIWQEDGYRTKFQVVTLGLVQIGNDQEPTDFTDRKNKSRLSSSAA